MKQQELISEYGKTVSTHWQVEGIILGHALSTFNSLTSFSASRHDADVVRLHFGLKGDYNFSYKQLGKSFDLIGGHHNLMYSRNFDMEVNNKTLEIETFGVSFPKEVFLKFTENASDTLKWFSESILKGESVILSDEWGSIDAGIQQVIQQVINCKYTGDLANLFLYSKSIELLVLSAEACEAAKNRKDAFIRKKTDKEKLIAARDMINERLHCPPNLTEVAKSVGLNEYKLKRGFKETFNNTVFGYLTDQRLNLAQQYLRDTEKTAAEVAYDLGYSSPQHFNNAFKNKFGITPDSVRKNP
ncbi:helix-turn-helix transcriptional regulator [Chondrinema litorale]|uniref:helix-turn-helix transcriptional regulator n=1 Tax=Chondrinema litorale TaxID=2994555 RepID=UPI002542E60B|nr:AraC family transcriptional regulator [Chondrinema litorale]UZR95219.1 AraC family transcriptional regulator [Chondrinema litorale]